MKTKINNTKPGAIILGSHIQALGIIRILGKDNIPCIILDHTHYNIARFSIYCLQFYKIETEIIFDKLLFFKANNQYKNWLIFPTHDVHVEILSKNKSCLEPYFKVTTDHWNVIENFFNKVKTYQLAQKLNIPIANTFFPKDSQDLTNSTISFPCIIKPAVMHSFYSQTKKKVFVCNNFQELEENYQKAAAIISKNEIIVQEIIEGPSKNQFSACFLFLNQRSIVSLTACRMRQHPADFGNATTFAETIEIPILIEYAKKILLSVKYNGLCEVEFKLDSRDNIYKFLEVNARTWKWHTIANKAKTPFVKTYYQYLNNQKIIPVNTFKNAAFKHPLTDFPIQIYLWKKKFDFAFKNNPNTENAVWDNKDPIPWFMEKILLPILFFSR